MGIIRRLIFFWKDVSWITCPFFSTHRGTHTATRISGNQNARCKYGWLVKLLECFGVYLWPTVVLLEICEVTQYRKFHLYAAFYENGRLRIRRSARQIPYQTKQFAMRVGPNDTTFCVVLTDEQDVPLRLAHVKYGEEKKRRELGDVPLF